MMNTEIAVGKYLPALGGYSQAFPAWMVGLGALFFLGVVLVLLALKCYALWLSARKGEKWWFLAIFLINSLGILEIIYLVIHRNRSEIPPASQNWS